MDVAEHASGADGDRRPDRLGAPGPRLSPRPRLGPAVAAVRNAVRDALADLPPGSPVLVACSGGADSLALAAATAFVAPRTGRAAGAVVVDHGWSPASAGVAASVGRTCTGLDLAPVDVVRVTCTGPGGPEAAARTARYAALDDAARRHGAAAVLLGHTRDDQAETVLLGLARGSGTRSLAGMSPVRGLLRRPLLGLGRDVTAAVCADLGLPVWTDPANSDPAFRRTRVRRLLPELDAALGPGLIAALSRTAEIAREDADVLDALAEDLFARALVDAVPGGDAPRAGTVVLDTGVLAVEPGAVRRRALLFAARRAGSPPGALGRGHVVAMDALITRWRGQRGADLPGGVRAERACGRLVLTLAGDPDADPPVARTNPDLE